MSNKMKVCYNCMHNLGGLYCSVKGHVNIYGGDCDSFEEMLIDVVNKRWVIR